jgi:alcohol dehydrogenase
MTDWKPALVRLGMLRAPATVQFGVGACSVLGDVAKQLGERVTICTDPQLAAGPHVDKVAGILRAKGLTVSVLDAAVPELPLNVIDSAVAAARALRPDCLIGLGGGSSLDLAKLVALGLAHDGPPDQFYGENAVPGPVMPIIGVPTTAGTGSEVTPVAVLSDPNLALKVGISSPYLIPRAAVCDPDLTMGAPRHVTAHAGIDALGHAIEAYTAIARTDWDELGGKVFVGKNLLSDTLGLSAVRCIAPHLIHALDDSKAARSQVLEGSLRAALAFGTSGTAAAHALQYPLGARTKTPHGLGIGLLLPYVMRFNRVVRADELSAVAEAMGCQEHTADAAIDAVAALAAEIGLPATLAELDLEYSELPALAGQALGIGRLVANNPRTLDLVGATSILNAAWHGDLSLVADDRSSIER